MKAKAASRILAALLTGAMALPMVPAAGWSVSVQATINMAWQYNPAVQEEPVLPDTVRTAFDKATKNLTDYELEPLAYYGIQVVAGYNYKLLCRMKDKGSDDWTALKEVVIYDDLDQDAGISSMKDFDLESYASNYTIDIPDEPANGGMEIPSGIMYGTIPQEAKDVFYEKLGKLVGVSHEPMAFLGKRYNDATQGFLYSYLCYVVPATANPDITITVVTITTDSENHTVNYTFYDLMGEKTVYEGHRPSIDYQFSGSNAVSAGYAEGSVTLKVREAGKYKLYWGSENHILEGYYPIAEWTLDEDDEATYNFQNHVAIPKDATRVVAVKDSDGASEEAANYYLPTYKMLTSKSGNQLYSFNAFSDIHIDKGSVWYVDADKNFKQALDYSVELGTDYIVVSGDCVTNDSGPEKEWDAYAKILSQSDYVNPVWESDGNHDLHQGVELGLKAFIKGSGTDGSQSNKSYFYMIEPKTGDVFIFMSLELNKDTKKYDQFSEAQLTWVTDLLEEYYGKRNIFLVEHAPIEGFGAGDRMSNPYYGGLMSQSNETTKTFKALLLKYPDIVFLSGHTHEDFDMNYNYSNENNTAAHMIHIPSLAGSTKANSTDDGLERNGGKGFNSQAYYVQVFENEIVFYGTNITDKKIYPQYSYIMEGCRTSDTPIYRIDGTIAPTNIQADVTEELAKVSYVLTNYYQFASYDSYQSLKKLYYEYKNSTMADTSVINMFETRIEALSAYTGTISYHGLDDTYYFVNNNNWSSVYAYAWTGSEHNAEWPGVKLTKFAANSYNQDVYRVKFNSKGEYQNLIFNSGSNTAQTIDIALAGYSGNGFYTNGTDSNGKYKVTSFAYTSSEDPIDEPVSGDTIALLYYVTDEHDWTQTDTLFKKDSDGKYRAELTASGDKTFSCSILNKTTNQYHYVSESQKLTFENGLITTYWLASSGTRGKSVSIYGLNTSSRLTFEYDPDKDTLTITCKDLSVPEELENRSAISKTSVPQNTSVTVTGAAVGGTGDYKYAFYYKKSTSGAWTTIGELYGNTTQVSFVPATVAKYLVKVNVKDSSGKIVTKQYTVDSTKPTGNDLVNTSFVDRTTVARNTLVSISGQASGGAGNYKYAFYYKKATSKAFTAIGEEYGDAATATFTPAMVADYNIRINVKDQDGTIVTRQYKITVVSAATLLNESTVSATKVTKGTPVTISAAASGAAAPYTFSFYYKKSTSSAWTQIRTGEPYTTFTPAVKATYLVKVVVTDSNGKTASKTFTITSG